MLMTTASTHHRPSSTLRRKVRTPVAGFTTLDYSDIKERANRFADHIEARIEELADILLGYESFEVVQDEIARTLDVLRNLRENKRYFRQRVGPIAAFLPRNQPLYALTCFVLVPSLMASEVHFRIPNSLRHIYPNVFKAVQLRRFFPNVIVSHQERLKFLAERSALRVNPVTQESLPVTHAVIFTGTSNHADRLRLIFDQRTLFIANGAGHNPIVVSDDADITKAIEAVLTLQLYNQGQDCAAPNAVLVHHRIYRAFMGVLRKELQNVRVGQYRDRSCRVGPISDPSDLVRIQQLLIDNRAWLDPSTPGIIRSAEAIVEPTIIAKPLNLGGNFTENFAPLMFVQRYESDAALSLYFESSHYARNAMYISLYGTSQYVEELIGRQIAGKVLHERPSVLYNTHLHAPGIERGTQPYGGAGSGASSLSIHGTLVCKATLPQRDIYECLVKSRSRIAVRGDSRSRSRIRTRIVHKDIPKLLGFKNQLPMEQSVMSPATASYIDSHVLKGDGRRYIRFEVENTFQLLCSPNLAYIATLEPHDLAMIRELRRHLRRRRMIPIDEFGDWLYALPKLPSASDHENRARQKRFFNHIYQLLLGKDSGPRLAHFLLDADRLEIDGLLDV